MKTSKFILIGGLLIIGIGTVNAAINKKPETPVLAGGIGVILLASILEAIGPGPGKVGNALVGLAATSVLIVEGPSLFQAINNAQGKK